MATFTNPFPKISATLTGVKESLEVIKKAVDADTDLTDSGKAAQWERLTTEHAKVVAQIETALETIGKNVTSAVQAERDKALPTATTDTGGVRAELEAQRILARGNLKSHGDIWTYFTEHGATPTRTTIVDEFEQRGIIDRESINGMIYEDSPEFARLLDMSKKFATVNGLFIANLRVVNELLAGRFGDVRYFFDGSVLGEDLLLEVPGTVAVPTWTPTQAEKIYRAR